MVGDLGVERKTEDGDLRVVPRTERLALGFGRESRRKGFQRVEVEVLNHGVELGRAGFEDLLSDEPSKDGVDGSEVS